MKGLVKQGGRTDLVNPVLEQVPFHEAIRKQDSALLKVDRQIDKKIDRQKEEQIERQIDRKKNRQKEEQIERRRDRKKKRQKEEEIER